MAYDKNIASGTIFDEIGYDEMQKAENHEIGFKLFRVLFFIALLFAFIMTLICEAAENVPGIIASLVFMAIVYGFYIAYAYMTAKRGIMNPKFAKGWSGKWVIPAYNVIALIWGTKLLGLKGETPGVGDISLAVMWLIIITGCIGISLCSMKNNRVLKKQLEETDEEPDRE